uniref:killer cell lectin-like receptor subfamily F member 1 isoform X2 n=1 Tax=Podarcis muralis TaxID=64176 RepID=UPI0010A09F34|nr:killer cell lectin-like receptor subfamily F member 1 isoform X2 [Podarcis muralis]
MEGEDGYTALNFQSRRAASGTAAGAQKQDASGLPCWYRITLWASGFVIIILGVAVTVLALQLEAEKGKILLNNGGCNASTDKFRASLRHNFCNQNQYSSSDNSPCKVCPMQWQLHRDKCYWPSDYMKTWDESQHDCSTRASQLLVIQDKEELISRTKLC